MAGATYTAGAGISIVDNIITNTGDISSTNEIQTLNLTGTTLSLSNGGGSVTLLSSINQSGVSLTGITPFTLSANAFQKFLIKQKNMII